MEFHICTVVNVYMVAGSSPIHPSFYIHAPGDVSFSHRSSPVVHSVFSSQHAGGSLKSSNILLSGVFGCCFYGEDHVIFCYMIACNNFSNMDYDTQKEDEGVTTVLHIQPCSSSLCMVFTGGLQGREMDLREQSFGLLHHLLRGAFIKYRISPNFLPVRSVYVT